MHADKVYAQVNYVVPGGNLKYDQTYSGQGAQQLVKDIDSRIVSLKNGRSLPEGSITFDKTGVELFSHNFNLSEFTSDESIKNNFYEEVQSFVTTRLNAKLSFIFDHTLRSEVPLGDTTSRRAPVKTVHSDFTQSSASRTVDQILSSLPKDTAKTLRALRYQLLNIWMPFKYDVFESPLAFCLPGSFTKASQHTLYLVYPDRIGKILGYSYEKKHEWLYFEKMTCNEFVMFKTFDSDMSQDIISVPHSAVELIGSSDKNKPFRRSVEFRLVIFFPD